MTYSDWMNLLNIVYSPDKLMLWAVLAVGLSFVLIILAMTVAYTKTKLTGCGTAMVWIIILLDAWAYFFWAVTYLWNKPLGPSLDLVVP